MCSTCPADEPMTCRACGALILEDVADICPDCESDINAYYDERNRREDEDYFRDIEMTEDNNIRENFRGV